MAGALPAVASPGDEAQFVSLINQSRAAAGLGALTGYADLTDDARVHTADMIAAGQVFHSTAAQLGSYASGWALLGENVGMGPNPALLHQAFMNSASHRANILGDYDLVGVGADRSGDGVMFVTVVFMKSAAPSTPPPPPTTTTTAPTTTTTQPPTTTTTAPPTTTTTTIPPTTTTTASPTTTAPTTAAPNTAPATPTLPSSDDGTPPSSTREDSQPTQSASVIPDGSTERPAAKVAGAITEREHWRFRPIFSMLGRPGSDPIVRFTTGGTPVTIE